VRSRKVSAVQPVFAVIEPITAHWGALPLMLEHQPHRAFAHFR
jgi:hypothetical protein